MTDDQLETSRQALELTPEQQQHRQDFVRELAAIHLNHLQALEEVDTHNKAVNAFVTQTLGRSADDQEMIEQLARLDKATYAQEVMLLLKKKNEAIYQESLVPKPPPIIDVTPQKIKTRPYNYNGEPTLFWYEKFGLFLTFVVVIGWFLYHWYLYLGDDGFCLIILGVFLGPFILLFGWGYISKRL